MASNPLQSVGLWRAKEGAIESMVPLAAAGGAWYLMYRLLSSPAVGRPLTPAELAVGLGAAAALTGWAASRQLYMLRRRKPWVLLLNGAVYTGVILFLLPRFTHGNFAQWCSEAGGALVALTDLSTGQPGQQVCRIGGVPGNPYLPGTLVRENWSGLSPLLWAFLLLTSGVSSLGLRDLRVLPTRIAYQIFERLRLAPAQGNATSLGKPKAKGDAIQACGNATLWGETCAQIFSAEKKFLPGEICPRCHQVFRPAPRSVTFRVVSLFTGDIDVLNGLERVDTVSWNRDEPMPPDARISGVERWVTLGRLQVPSVLTVAQVLAIAHELLPKWASQGDLRVKTAAQLAQRRASRVSAWIWFGRVSHRLTYARPTRRAILAVGTSRIQDLVTDGAEELTLQLDIGLLPLELRVGFKKTFVEEGRPPEYQNSKLDLWVPVSPPRLPKKQAGLWVPRVEGSALRAWLSTERLRSEDERGVSIPLPYSPYVEGAEPDLHVPAPGSLDMVRMAYEKRRDQEQAEPDMQRSIGDSIAEWDWLEWEQIQLLRQQCLVLVENRGGR